MSKAGKIFRAGDLKNVKNIIGNYRLEKTIGEGTFGKVKYAIHLPTEERVAVKILEKEKIQDKEDLDRITREINFLKKLKHQNIIKIYEIVENSKNFYIIMEYACGGELFNYIVKKKRLDEKEASCFFYQIVNSLDYIHKNNIVHRDLKPENLLLTENNILKVIDFGLSNQYKTGQLLQTPCGSPCYAAPEMILGRKYSGLMVDIWSIGIILYAMICGYLPFEDKNNDKLYKKILECKIEFPEHVANDTKDLIKKILTINPTKRIKLEEIKSHPFLKSGEFLYKKGELTSVQEKTKLSEVIIEKMIDLGFDKSDIAFNIENNKHNNITTTYDLLFNKLKNTPTLVSSSSEKSSTENNIEPNQNININISMNKIGNINININEKKKEEIESEFSRKNKKDDKASATVSPDKAKKLKIVKHNSTSKKTHRYSNRSVNTIDVINTSPERGNFKQLNYNKNRVSNYVKGYSISHKTNISTYSNSKRDNMSVNNLKDNNNSLTLDLPTFIQNNKLDSHNIIIGTSKISPLNKLNKFGKKNNINFSNMSNPAYSGRTMAFGGHERKINTSVSVDKKEFSTTMRSPFSESGQNFGSSVASKLVPNNTIDLTNDLQKINTSIHSHKPSYALKNDNNPIKRANSISEDKYNLNDNRKDALKDKTSPHKLNETLEKTENKKNSTRSHNIQSSQITNQNYTHQNKNNYMQNIISDFRKRIKNLSIGEKSEINVNLQNQHSINSNSSKFGSTIMKSSDSQSNYDNYSQSKYQNINNLISNQTINMQTLSNKDQGNPEAVKSGSSSSLSSKFPNSTKNKNQMAFQSFRSERKQETSNTSNRNTNSSTKRNQDVSKISRMIDLTNNTTNKETNTQKGRSPNSSYQQKFKQRVVGFAYPTVAPVTTVTLLTQSSTNSSNVNDISLTSINTTTKKKSIVTVSNKPNSVKRPSVDKKANQVKATTTSTGYGSNLVNLTPSSLKYDKYVKPNTIKSTHPSQNSTSLKFNESLKEKDLLHNLNKNKSQNADFACCTLSGTNAVDVNIKLQEYCQTNNLILKEHNPNNFECSKENNVISIEITKLGSNKVMKLQHFCGSESITKDMIKNIIINIGF